MRMDETPLSAWFGLNENFWNVPYDTKTEVSLCLRAVGSKPFVVRFKNLLIFICL